MASPIVVAVCFCEKYLSVSTLDVLFSKKILVASCDLLYRGAADLAGSLPPDCSALAKDNPLIVLISSLLSSRYIHILDIVTTFFHFQNNCTLDILLQASLTGP